MGRSKKSYWKKRQSGEEEHEGMILWNTGQEFLVWLEFSTVLKLYKIKQMRTEKWCRGSYDLCKGLCGLVTAEKPKLQ